MTWEPDAPETIAAMNIAAQFAAGVYNLQTVIDALGMEPNAAMRANMLAVVTGAIEQLTAQRDILAA